MTSRPDLLAGEDLPPKPRQKRSLERRTHLMAAGLDLFGRKGYTAASVDDIARRACLPVGSFYQHFRSKRQLLLALMDELLDHLSRLELRPQAGADIRVGLRALLSGAFSADLRYLGAYRAWQEAALSDAGLARKQKKIHAWTTTRVHNVLLLLSRAPGARPAVDTAGLAQALDAMFWSLLGQALQLSEAGLNQWLDAATHLIYHAMFLDLREAKT